jgi:hypothetical protein
MMLLREENHLLEWPRPAAEKVLMMEPEMVIDRVSKVYKTESSDPVFALEETTLKVARGKFVCIL